MNNKFIYVCYCFLVVSAIMVVLGIYEMKLEIVILNAFAFMIFAWICHDETEKMKKSKVKSNKKHKELGD